MQERRELYDSSVRLSASSIRIIEHINKIEMLEHEKTWNKVVKNILVVLFCEALSIIISIITLFYVLNLIFTIKFK